MTVSTPEFQERHREATTEGQRRGLLMGPQMIREDELQRAWRQLVKDVIATHDLDSLNALKAFQLKLESFLNWRAAS